MTRKKQIEKAAHEYINSDVVPAWNETLAFGDFINGAEWADKTMLDKAVEWIRRNINNYLTYNIDGEPFVELDEFINDFKAKMEEQ